MHGPAFLLNHASWRPLSSSFLSRCCCPPASPLPTTPTCRPWTSSASRCALRARAPGVDGTGGHPRHAPRTCYRVGDQAPPLPRLPHCRRCAVALLRAGRALLHEGPPGPQGAGTWGAANGRALLPALRGMCGRLAPPTPRSRGATPQPGAPHGQARTSPCRCWRRRARRRPAPFTCTCGSTAPSSGSSASSR